MTVLWTALAVVGLLLVLSGLAQRVIKALTAVTAALQFVGYATVRSAIASEQSLKTAKEQIEMNRQLVEAVRSRPPTHTVELSIDEHARKH